MEILNFLGDVINAIADLLNGGLGLVGDAIETLSSSAGSSSAGGDAGVGDAGAGDAGAGA